jgi:hypothetical protein
MLEWLTGRKKNRRELPEYSHLREFPTRALPSDLALEESGELFRTNANAIEENLRQTHLDPEHHTPHFTVLIVPGDEGVVTIPMSDGDRQCLPVFSTPFRGADYQQILLRDPGVQYLTSTAAELFRLLCDVEKAGVEAMTLDRCPRCSIFTVTRIASLKSPDDAIVLWAIHKATETARFELYYAYALRSARAGQLETARDVALEAVGHVNLEDPRPHLLLGELAVALGDRTLLQEAQTFLRFFKHERWVQKLALAESGQPLFEDGDLL